MNKAKQAIAYRKYKLLSGAVAAIIFLFAQPLLAGEVMASAITGVNGAELNNNLFRNVSGTVQNEAGEPLSGVSVQVSGTQRGTTTDNKGAFAIDANTGDVLIFSAIGYNELKITVGNAGPLTIVLETQSVKLEDDVVVVGYGKQKKITTTGAVSQITGDDVRRTPGASLQNMLAGKMPGYFSVQRTGQPGADAATFFIRGISTFEGNNQAPLVMVDDIEFELSQLARIDPNEVESVTILKDAGTTAIYGVKGANGVILVTTKRGKTGVPVIGFKSQFGLQKPIKPAQYLDSYNAALLRNQALVNSGSPVQFTDEDLELYRNGSDPYRHPNVDWYNTLMKNGSPMVTNNLDISGGTDRVKYFASLGYLCVRRLN